MRDLPAEVVADAVAWRRQLHRNPELGFQEHETAGFIAAKLAEFGYEVRRGIGRTGVVGSLAKGSGNRAIGIRADIDALPIAEASRVEWASGNPGRAHACGHDGHTAVALAAARLLAGMPFEGTLRFIFQPAEENEGGGRAMVEDGLFRDCPVDAVYALHNWPGLPEGSFAIRPGPISVSDGMDSVTLGGS